MCEAYDKFQFTQTAGSDVIKDFDAKDKIELWGRRNEDSDKLSKIQLLKP